MSDFLAKINAQIDEAAIEAAKKRKQALNARDALLLAMAAGAALQRRCRESDQVRTESGARLFDRTTRKEITDVEVNRADRKTEEARAAFTEADTLANQADARLNNLQKQREEWLRIGEYEASQRAAEANLSPREKAIREARALLAEG
jgi:hypothetical protein